MKRGQLAAVIVIVLLVAAVAGFFVFSEKRAGQATNTLSRTTSLNQPAPYTVANPTVSPGVMTSSGATQPAPTLPAYSTQPVAGITPVVTVGTGTQPTNTYAASSEETLASLFLIPGMVFQGKLSNGNKMTITISVDIGAQLPTVFADLTPEQKKALGSGSEDVNRALNHLGNTLVDIVDRMARAKRAAKFKKWNDEGFGPWWVKCRDRCIVEKDNCIKNDKPKCTEKCMDDVDNNGFVDCMKGCAAGMAGEKETAKSPLGCRGECDRRRVSVCDLVCDKECDKVYEDCYNKKDEYLQVSCADREFKD